MKNRNRGRWTISWIYQPGFCQVASNLAHFFPSNNRTKMYVIQKANIWNGSRAILILRISATFEQSFIGLGQPFSLVKRSLPTKVEIRHVSASLVYEMWIHAKISFIQSNLMSKQNSNFPYIHFNPCRYFNQSIIFSKVTSWPFLRKLRVF